MNSLPLNPEIIRPNKPATIIFYEVLPVAEFSNCMYWHDIEDKSLISLGSVKISRVYHCTYAGFINGVATVVVLGFVSAISLYITVRMVQGAKAELAAKKRQA